MYQFMVNTCQRVSVGGFERGPVSFMLEQHWGVDPPDSCRDFNPGFDQAAVLLALWVDDPEVATYLRAEYHLPVEVGQVHEEVMPQDDMEIQTWTWQTEGAEQSTLVVVHPGGSEGKAAPTNRLIWHNGTGVSFLDLTSDRDLPQAFVPTAHGVLAPPMRYAQSGPTPFTGLTSTWKTSDHFGPFYRFGDLECKQPLS